MYNSEYMHISTNMHHKENFNFFPLADYKTVSMLKCFVFCDDQRYILNRQGRRTMSEVQVILNAVLDNSSIGNESE